MQKSEQGKNRHLYVAGNGWISALDKNTGEIIGEIQLTKQGWFASRNLFISLLEGLDHLYAVSDGIVFAIDRDKGRILWQNEVERLRSRVAVLSADGAAAAAATQAASRATAAAVAVPGGGGRGG